MMIPTIVDSLQGDLEKFTESLDISLLIKLTLKLTLHWRGSHILTVSTTVLTKPLEYNPHLSFDH